jgi:hypothetical protein
MPDMERCETWHERVTNYYILNNLKSISGDRQLAQVSATASMLDDSQARQVEILERLDRIEEMLGRMMSDGSDSDATKPSPEANQGAGPFGTTSDKVDFYGDAGMMFSPLPQAGATSSDGPRVAALGTDADSLTPPSVSSSCPGPSGTEAARDAVIEAARDAVIEAARTWVKADGRYIMGDDPMSVIHAEETLVAALSALDKALGEAGGE